MADVSCFKIVIVTVRNKSSESGTLCRSRAAPLPSTSATALYRDPLGKALAVWSLHGHGFRLFGFREKRQDILRA
jgi:hypothetical protein